MYDLQQQVYKEFTTKKMMFYTMFDGVLWQASYLFYKFLRWFYAFLHTSITIIFVWFMADITWLIFV